uniref:Acyl carrier protein 3-like n=1 Tax=Rhizophora mucronata TaxID=61149 RepID=A0A2P2KBH4_RHIMU
MQGIRTAILSHIRLRSSTEQFLLTQRGNVFKQVNQLMCASTVTGHDQIISRVIEVVKKFDKIDDAAKVPDLLFSSTFEFDTGLSC